MTEPVDGEEDLFDETAKADEDTEAMEATTTLIVFREEGFWGNGE